MFARKFLCAVVFIVLMVVSQIACTRVPREGADVYPKILQGKSAKSILLKLFPENEQVIRELTIKVHPGRYPDSAIDNSKARKTLFVTAGLLLFVEGEDEFVAILAHEWGHFVLGHRPEEAEKVVRRIKYDPDGDDQFRKSHGGFVHVFETVIDFEVLERQQIEADKLAVETLGRNGYDKCALTRVMEKLSQFDGWQKDPEDPHSKIGLKRLRILKESCALVAQSSERERFEIN